MTLTRWIEIYSWSARQHGKEDNASKSASYGDETAPFEEGLLLNRQT